MACISSYDRHFEGTVYYGAAVNARIDLCVMRDCKITLEMLDLGPPAHFNTH